MGRLYGTEMREEKCTEELGAKARSKEADA